VGAVVGGIAGAFVTHGSTTLTPTVLLVSLVAQEGATIGYLVWASKAKGLGSLRADFGLTVHFDDIGWFFGGLGLQLLALIPTALLVAVHGHQAKQDVVKSAESAHGITIPLIILGVGVLAPLTEELLFRGALLRSLLRRLTPDRAVFLTAVVFGAVHLLGDPSVGSLIALPVIILLGVVSGYQAVKTGNLSRSVMLHMGFNALTVVLLFV
jgi:membrane protease YdiL (CAAX protease family)